MDRDTIVSCFAAVAVLVLLDRIFQQFTTALISAVILVLLAVILVLVVGGGIEVARKSRRR